VASPEGAAAIGENGRANRFELPIAGRAIAATVVLLIIGAIVAPGSLSASGLLSILPFMAILAMASIGQHLVIQQRGLDLSVAGVVSFAAVIVTALPARDAGLGGTVGFVLLALVMGLCAGAISGLIISALRVPPLVTTIGVNALLVGATLVVSGGTPSPAPGLLSQFALSRTIGIPNTVLTLIVVTAVVIFIIGRTPVGRRFVAVGVNPDAAHAIGVNVELYRIVTYTFAGFCYALAGVLLAGFLSVPSLFSGNPYMLATVAAVVVGGNSIAGGAKASVLATVVGALFLTYLGQLVLSVGFDRSIQDIVQAIIVVSGVALPQLLRRSGRS
jgi:ribose/xylose/arabinose/galactoside ABC-type transport system permease subunit